MSNFISNHVYRNIISSIVNSTPDRRVGCRPEDLLSYVKEVFEFDEKTHKVIVEEETANKPEYELCVTLLEGRNIATAKCCHVCPYCILTISKKGASNSLHAPSQPQRKLSDGFPYGHQGGDSTPRLSDAFETQMQYSSCLFLQDSETPRWNEEFRFSIGNERKQNLFINVLRSECLGNNNLVTSLRTHSDSHNHHSNPGSMTNINLQSKKDLSPVNTIKNVMSALTKNYNSCNCKAKEELIGTCSLYLKDLPVNRACEKLLPIVRKKSALTEFVSLSNSVGAIRLKIRLASKANSCVSDLPEADHVITLEDVASVIRRFHLHNAMRQHQKYDRACIYGGDLPDCSDAILEQFLVSNNFQRLTRHVINLAVLLEWHSLGVDWAISEQALQFSLERVRCSYMDTPMPFGSDFDNSSTDFFSTPVVKTPCPYYHIEYLYDRTIQFLNYYLNSLSPHRVRFFPPCSEHGLETFGRKLNEFCSDLCRLELWMWGRTKQPSFHFRRLLTGMVESDTRTWFLKEKEELSELLDNNTMQYVCKLTNILDLLDDAHRSYAASFNVFFQKLDIDYSEIVVPIVDSEVSEMTIQLFGVFTLSQRHVYYDREMLQNACKNTSRLYFTVKRVMEVLHEANKTIPLQLSSYQNWFNDCLELWLHTTKVTSFEFIMKSTQKDADLEKAAANVNFTASTVDTLAICKGACDEFVQLQLSDSNTRLLATIKIVDIICDNIIGFAKHLHNTVLAKYNHCSGKVQILRAANSICHVGQYLMDKLPEFLQCGDLFRALAERFGKESQEYQQAKITMTRLACYTSEVINGLAADLIEMIMKQLKPDIEKYSLPISAGPEIQNGAIRKYLMPLQKAYMKQSLTDDHLDALLHYLEKCLHALRGGLQAPLFELSLSRIWTMTMECIRRNTPIGQAPGYYEQLEHHLKMLHQYFDLPSYNQIPAEWFDRYMAQIELQSRSTADLILGHYAALSDLEFSPTLYDEQTYRGRLDVKVGYQRVSGEKINIIVKIIEGIELPNLDHDSPASTASIRISLCPQLFFPRLIHCMPVKMEVRTLAPSSEDTVEFVIPESYPYGSALGFLLIASECIAHSDLAGTAFVHLGRIPQLSWKETIDDMPIVTLPLLLITNAEQLGSAYQVLNQRRHWDTIAGDFLRVWDCILQKRCSPISDGKMQADGEKLHQRIAVMISRGTQRIKATAAHVKRRSQPKL